MVACPSQTITNIADIVVWGSHVVTYESTTDSKQMKFLCFWLLFLCSVKILNGGFYDSLEDFFPPVH
jgi:hypothetical protein